VSPTRTRREMDLFKLRTDLLKVFEDAAEK
jgi:hypothetical protein